MRTRKKMTQSQDMDLKPFMNLMVTLIPMLLISAEFAKVAVIDIKLPEARGSQTKTAVTEQPKEDKSEKLLLTAIITDSVVTLGAKGGFMPSLFYREYHHYIAKDDDKVDFTVEYEPGKAPKHPKTGRDMEIYERYDIYLYTVNENREILKTMYTNLGEMLTNSNGEPVTTVNAGDTVYALSNPRRVIVVSNVSEFELKPMSAYDELKNRLMKVKERYREAEDGNDIIIAAENQVIYDKIIQIMDKARESEFPNISIAKLRG